DREETQLTVVTQWDSRTRLLTARNPYHPDYGGRVAFVASSLPIVSFTGDRAEFLGRNGTAARPAALSRTRLAGRVGAGLDPCAAIQVQVEIDPDHEVEVVFLLGQADDANQAQQVAERFRSPQAFAAAFQATRDWWDRLLGTIEVEAPDLCIGFLMNRWLPYQALSCRIWGRSAFYQSGGAFGFRDQLQDVMAMVYASPQTAREQILRSAARQFVEGDVQHWWHPPSGAGVRTRISDDLLWLPFVTAHYVRTTGDASILDETAPFIEGKQLEENEHDAYFVPTVSEQEGSLLEHCRRAIQKGLTAGPHGLPLIGAGDWNDGLNLVGAEGKGESVWLAWFLIHVLNDFAELLEQRNGAAEAAEARKKAATIAKAAEDSAWDGEWYRRGYFDDGAPLGSKQSDEAKIDSLPQSWGAICGAADAGRVRQAMASVRDQLVRPKDKLVLLFTPPFDKTTHDPGYIKGYPPGVRENGGQYTHGSLWAPMALARMGDGDGAVELLQLMNPVEHAREEQGVARYKVEPYVACADVYSLERRVGQGGWTWYTGAAGWMYRIWLEEVLGFRLRGDKLTIDPCIPSNWPGFTLRYQHGTARYTIKVENPSHICRGVQTVELDGRPLRDPVVTLADDGADHTVRVTLWPG
ncbi:MAG TPA: protein ndvB, partial [Chthonomonadaceae bacterium]|nr:protein ndvB [Chthonomonadaceae bacterium]